MGWNDHVELIETYCKDCGVVDVWEYWNEVAKARYGGKNRHLGLFLGRDDNNSGRCPNCGSTNGPVEDDGS